MSSAPPPSAKTDPRDLLRDKMANPSLVLSTTESISLFEHCVQLGEQNAGHAINKDIVMTFGITGTGKSTFLNALLGCKMKFVRRCDLGLSGSGKVVIVDPKSTQPEIVPIGHISSETFLPQIAPEPNHPERAFCDCPGFLDNRGAEINIANAINIKRVLQSATSIKAVFLADYSSFMAGRGNNVRAMEQMCLQMFGGVDNLKRHQNAVLLGITKVSPWNYEDEEPTTLDEVRAALIETVNSPTIQVLADRLFLYDPLDRGRGNPVFWSLERCRKEIAQLQSIPNQETTTLFHTVLTDSDKTQLRLIMRNRATALAEALEQDDFQTAGNHWQSLAGLEVIEHDEVKQMREELVERPLTSFVQRRVSSYTEEVLKNNFDEATRQLDLLRPITGHFPPELMKKEMESLSSLLIEAREKKAIEEEGVRNRILEAEQAAARESLEEYKKRVKEAAMEFIRLIMHMTRDVSTRLREVLDIETDEEPNDDDGVIVEPVNNS